MDRLKEIFGEELFNEILNTKDLYKKSDLIINHLFKGVKDKSGNPYTEHLYFVSSQGKGDASVVGLMHDTLEDTSITSEDLELLGYPNNIIESIKTITRRTNEKYDEFIDRIISSNDLDAIKVKERDMRHNMDEKRLINFQVFERKRLLKKYTNNYKKIIEKIKEMEK